jgi:hypothetical protein
MLSFISSFLNINSEDSARTSSTKSDIIKILKKKNLTYSNVSNGINVDISNTENDKDIYTITIPLNFKDTHYIHIKKNLKSKDGDCINCIYLYKIKDAKLEFVNRIKIIDLSTIKCDEDNSRISNTIIKSITDLLNEILNINHQSETIGGEADTITNSDIQNFRYLKYKSKYNKLKNIMNTSVTDSELSSESNESNESDESS